MPGVAGPMGNRVRNRRELQRNRAKCQQCRKDHAKCLPVDRTLPQKCSRCLKYNKECSENLGASQERANATLYTLQATNGQLKATGRQLQATEGLAATHMVQAASDQLQTQSNYSTGSASEGYMVVNPNELETEDVTTQGFSLALSNFRRTTAPGFSRQLGNNVTEIDGFQNDVEERCKARQLLNSVDYLFELYKVIQGPLLQQITPGQHPQSHADILLSYVKDIVGERLSRLLQETETCGDNTHHPSERQYIYIRLADIWETIRKQMAFCGDDRIYVNLLHKIKQCYMASGEDIKMEETLIKLATQSQSDPEDDIHQLLADSFKKTCEIINMTAKKYDKPSLKTHLNLASPRPALHRAIQSGAFHAFKILISESHGRPSTDLLSTGPLALVVEIEKRDVFKRTPLCAAACSGNYQFLSTLIQRDANIRVRDYNGCTVLETASRHGYMENVQALINEGAEINPKLTKFSSTPLQAATEEDHVAIVQCLLKAGAERSTMREHDGKIAIEMANGKNGENIRKLLRDAEGEGFSTSPISVEMANAEAVLAVLDYNSSLAGMEDDMMIDWEALYSSGSSLQ